MRLLPLLGLASAGKLAKGFDTQIRLDLQGVGYAI